MTRFPGQRERRRGINGAGQPADRGLDSGDGGRATDQRSRGGSQRRVRPALASRTAAGSGNRPTGRKTGIARRIPLGRRRAMCWSKRRLTPEDRPVVDRSTLWVGPGRLRQRKQAAPPGASHRFRTRPTRSALLKPVAGTAPRRRSPTPDRRHLERRCSATYSRTGQRTCELEVNHAAAPGPVGRCGLTSKSVDLRPHPLI
jgi:hypothetical protein